ncbi:MAG: FAD-dependent oxidoreductase, partial [Candidatus Rokubacteria bacterium]|nr:FAD-dependent oxidoreductase [Candidatus Rokubacteria bacterium]
MSRGTGLDVIVVGGGHNGLVAAAYLARAGLRVLVLERRPSIGGTVGTVGVRRGVRAPAVFPTVGRLHPSIARDLRLADHGLRLVAPAVALVAPQPEGPAVVVERDAEATAVRLAAFSAADAAGFLAIARRVRALARLVAVHLREAVLEGVEQQLVEHHRQRGGHVGRQHAERGGPAQVDLRLGGGDVDGGGRDAVDHAVEGHLLVDRGRQRLVHDRDRGDPAHRLLERGAGVGRGHPSGLQPQQGRHGLQVVLHPMVDLPDRRVLGQQGPLLAADLGHV